MVVKSAKGAYFSSVFLLLLITLAAIIFAGLCDVLWCILLFAICFTIVASYMTVIGKTLEFSSRGCNVKVWGREKFYSWADLTIKRVEGPHLGLRTPYHRGGIFFSPCLVKKPAIMDPTLYCMLFHPFSCFYVYFVHNKSVGQEKGTMGIYEVNQDTYLELLRQWGVRLDS